MPAPSKNAPVEPAKPHSEPATPHPEHPSDAPAKPAYADGPNIVDEQRARSDMIEKMGIEAYKSEVMDKRPPEGATPKQVPGVAPPTKRD